MKTTSSDFPGSMVVVRKFEENSLALAEIPFSETGAFPVFFRTSGSWAFAPTSTLPKSRATGEAESVRVAWICKVTGISTLGLEGSLLVTSILASYLPAMISPAFKVS